jgi:ClpP class serine protease
VRALEFITSQPWLITDEALQTILSLAERTALDPEALATREGRPLSNTRSVQMIEGAAVIPVVGPIFRYANLFTEISGATSTQVLATDFRTALDDVLVRAIVFDINSPGGTASGIHELANMIFEARGRKPIIAYGGGQVASAAYWIGSAADELVVDAISPVGSIGAKLSILDTSQRDAKAGVRQIEIVSSQSPDKVLDVNQDEGRAKVQKIVDDLAGVFVEAVARNRGVTTETVLADYGRGGMMVGQAAVDAGLADRLGSLDSVLSELIAARDPQRRSFIMATTSAKAGAAKGPITVSTTAELADAVAKGHTVEEISIKSVDVEAIKTEAHAAGLEAGKAELAAATTKAASDATAAERKRVMGLQGIAMKGFEPEIQKAIESGATVEATAVEVTKIARTRGTNLASQRNDAPDAVNHGGADAAAGSKKSWDKVKGRMNKKAQAKARA